MFSCLHKAVRAPCGSTSLDYKIVTSLCALLDACNLWVRGAYGDVFSSSLSFQSSWVARQKRVLLSVCVQTMGSGVGRVNKHKGSNKRGRRKRTLARAVDQIYDDMADPLRAEALRSKQPIDFDLPGLGQHYCIECARYFIDANVLVQHTRTKLHKNRIKELKEKPYSQAEAEAASGMAPNDRGM
jgi:bud site selection protein 20